MNVGSLRAWLAAFAFLLLPWSARAGLLINEILFNPPGNPDSPNEYIELRGTPNTVLADGTFFLSVEGDGSGFPGTIQNIFDLSGRTIGQNGFLVLLQKFHRYLPNKTSTVLTNSDSGPGWGSGSSSSIRHKGEDDQTELENPSCTFFLIQTATAPHIGDDIDAFDNGIINQAVLNAWTILDSVSVLDNDGSGDIGYGQITFRRDSSPGNAAMGSGTIVPVPFTPSYVGRNGNSTGWAATDWVASDNLIGKPPTFRLGINSLGHTNTVPTYRSGAYLNHLGKQNFGAPAIPAVLVKPPAAGIKLNEGGASGAYYFNLSTTPTGRVTIRIDAPAGLLISTDGGVSYGSSRAVTLATTVLRVVRVRAPQDTNVDISPRFGLITHTITNTLDPAHYPLSTIIPSVKVQTIDNEFALLSELKVNPPGEDAPFEFVEIRGTPNALLTNIYLVAIDSNGGGNPGTALLVVNLTSYRFGTNGLLVVAGTGNPYLFPAATTVVLAPQFSQAGGALDNGPLSILLVGSPSPIIEGTDLDNGNNGVLEGLPDGSAILDAIGWSDGGNNDVIYGGVDLTQRSFVPDAATRFRTNNMPRSAAAWMVGDLAGGNGASIAYDDFNVSSNLPPGTMLSAGIVNDTAPSVSPLAPLSHVIGDPQNPTATFTVKDDQTPAGALVVTATSTIPAVVPDANLTLTHISGGTWRLAIDPIGVGYSDIILHVSNGIQEGRGVLHYAASEMGRPGAHWHTGVSDASTAIALDANWMVVGDDENQTLRIYSRTRSGGSAKGINMNPFLALTDLDDDGTPREVDIEASTRVGNRLFWLGSHSHSFDAQIRTNRGRLFATDLIYNGSNSVLKLVGHYDFLKVDLIEWDKNNLHGKGAGYYGLEASGAVGVDPKSPDGSGFNIEGLCMAPGSATKAYVAFRAPLIPPTNRFSALIVPITNFTTLASKGGDPGSARFGPPIELNLGGRGIRSIEGNGGGYLIIAGPPGRATNTPPFDFRLFTWNGQPATAPVERDTDLTGLNPEGIIALPAAPWTPSSRAQVVSDNGVTVYYNDGIEAKHLLVPNFKKFRSDWVTLGNPMTNGTAMLMRPAAIEPDPGTNKLAGGGETRTASFSGAQTFTTLAPPPQIISIATSNTSATVTWSAIPGHTYRVQFKASLAQSEWSEIPGDVTATGDTAMKTDDFGSAPQRFYRVFAVP